MTGQQLIQQVRALFPQMPVILATGYAEMPPDLAPDVMRLAKPFVQEQLLQAVGSAMIED